MVVASNDEGSWLLESEFLRDRSQGETLPGPPKECLLVGFENLKTFITHTFGGPGR